MTDDKGPETGKLLPQARTGNFSVVTTAGNKCAAALKEIAQAEPDTVVRKIRQVMPELLQLTVSVTFEKAKIWNLVETDPNLSYFANMDYDSWMNPGDLNKSELEKAKVTSL